ncbi:MAG: hypothetical protein ACI8WT_003139 [Clostridium sp.]|jgi:hypothetical protein
MRLLYSLLFVFTSLFSTGIQVPISNDDIWFGFGFSDTSGCSDFESRLPNTVTTSVSLSVSNSYCPSYSSTASDFTINTDVTKEILKSSDCDTLGSLYVTVTKDRYYMCNYVSDPCVLPSVYDANLSQCVTPPPPDHDNDGVPDKCDPDHLFVSTADCDGNGVPNASDPNFDSDGDGIPNGTDLDDDGDGIPDTADTDHPDYANAGSACTGVNLLIKDYLGSQYAYDQYNYYGVAPKQSCFYKILGATDGVFSSPDLSPTCEKEYCYTHKTAEDCVFSSNKYKPAGSWTYSPDTTESECSALVDGVKWISSTYVQPSLFCPNTFMCYVQFYAPPEESTNTENNDSTMNNNIDLNSTSVDNTSLLQSQNTGNKHLSDIKDKIDLTNGKLDKSNGFLEGIKNTQSDMKSSLDGFALDNKKGLGSQLSESKLMNTSLTNVNTALSTSNGYLKSMNSMASNNNNKLSSIDLRLSGIKDELLSDHGIIKDEDDGLGDLLNIETDLKGSFNGFVENNIFAFSGSSYAVPTVSFSILGKTFTLMNAQKMASVDIASFRLVMLFFFAVSGFIVVFKTV